MVEIARLSTVFEADTGPLEKGTKKAEGLVGGLGGALGSVGGLALGGAIAGVAGLGAGLFAAGKSAADFQSQISGVAAVGGPEAIARLSEIGDKALQVGKDTSFSATEAAAGMEELIKAGISIEHVLGPATDAMVALAAATGESLAASAEVAANAMNQFGLAGEDMASIADTVTGATVASAIGMNDFKFSLASVGAVANLVGLSFEDTAVAIAEMGQAGIKGSDAGTSLKAMLMNLIPSTNAQRDLMKDLGLQTVNLSKAQELAAKSGSAIQDATDPKFWPSLNEAVGKNMLGIQDWSKATDKQRKEYDKLLQSSGAMSNQFFDQTGAVKPLVEIQGVLADALKDMNKQQQLATLEVLFGSDAIRAAAVLAEAGTAGYTEMADAMGKISAADVAKTRLDNLNGSLEALKGSLEVASITIGTAMLPSLKLLVDGGIELLNANMPLIEQFAASLPGAMAAAGNFITGTLVPALSEVWTWLSTNLPPVLAFISGTAWPALVDAGTAVATKVGEITTFFSELFTELEERGVFTELKTAWDELQLAGAAIGRMFAEDFNPQMSIATGEAVTSKGVMLELAGNIATTAKNVNEAATAIKNLFEWMEKARATAADLSAILSGFSGGNVLAGFQALQRVMGGGGASVNLPGGGGGQRGPDLIANNVGQGQIGLSPNEAAAACGPYAAMLFYNSIGRFPTGAEAVELGRKAGWTPGQGMGGSANFVKMLNLGGVNAAMDYTPTIAEATASLQSGSPLAFSTPRHYFAASGVDESGRFNVGGSGTVLGGSEWMTIEEMEALGGGMQGVISIVGQYGPAVQLAATQANTALQSNATTVQATGAAWTTSLAQGIGQGDTVVTNAVEAIVQAAIANGMDPMIALALAKAESNFNPAAVGDNGASVGLFQLHERGQGAGMGASRADPGVNANTFLASHKELYAQLVASGLAGEQLAMTFGRIAEGSDPAYAQRYGQAYRELTAQFGTTQAASLTFGASQQTAARDLQYNAQWVAQMAAEQTKLSAVMSGQVDPDLIHMTAAMTNFGAVLGPIERQVAGGAISMDTLQFKLVDLARATGLATTPWADYNAGLIDINEAMMRVVTQSAAAGPQFEALRQSLGTTNTITDQGTLKWLQLALAIGRVAPAEAAVTTATTAATTATTGLTTASSAVMNTIDPALFTQAAQTSRDMAEALAGADRAFMNVQESAAQASEIVKEFLGAAESLGSYLDGHTFKFHVDLPDLPDWAIPGSPMPLETGFRGVADALDVMNRKSGPALRSLEMPSASAAMAERGGGRGSAGGDTYNSYHFPNYVGSKEELVETVHSGLLQKKRTNGRLGLGDSDGR